ncbi:hypothetical protein [Nocardia brasiliensis]|uniref:hypothetical protein n=1 Tax=Nocardia brasiliensis TaxID=37326 RepID=UPI00366DAD02
MLAEDWHLLGCPGLRESIGVDVYPASIGHDACAPEGVRWSEGLFPNSPAQPLHANTVGHHNEALILTDAIRRNPDRKLLVHRLTARYQLPS